MKRWGGLGVLLLGLACGKSDELTLDRFGGEASRVICDKAYSCCTTMELTQHMDYGGGRAACGDKTKQSLDGWAATIEVERAKGRLTYDPGLARTCFDSYAAASCEQHKRNPSLLACDNFVAPKTAPGSPCRANESCMGGGCMGATFEHDGVCAAFVTAGDSCASAPCAKGTFCDGAKICRQVKVDGEVCNLNVECQSAGCNGRNPDAGTPGTCGDKGGPATSCYVTTGCAYGVRASASPGTLVLALSALALLSYALRRVRNS
jgi:hypothetical protein